MSIEKLTYMYSNKEEWNSVYQELQTKNLNLSDISRRINSHFGDQVHRARGLNEHSFSKLEQLVGHAITISKTKTVIQRIKLKRNEKLAEMIGILLGDGHISDQPKRFRFTIALNSAKDLDYIDYVDNLIQDLFSIIPSRYQFKEKNCLVLMVSGKPIITELLRHGLHRGNKVKNQVGVPDWVKNNYKYSLACIKGLFDTDGCISLNKFGKTILKFVNASRPLVNFFDEFSQILEVNPCSYSYDDLAPFVHINGQSSVKRFLEIVKPRKAIYYKIRNPHF